jgi:hypothetical protein
LHGLQSRKAVSIIKEHQVTVLIFTGRNFSLGVTERAKRELCFYVRRRLEPAPSGRGATQAGACAERGEGDFRPAEFAIRQS